MIIENLSDFMLPQNLHIAPKTIGKLLKEERLKVPPSQREYRWKPEHAEDLFKDMRKAIDNGEEHFLGTIVSINVGNSILIYDGQQRLATTMILLAAIRDRLISLGNDADAEITERSYLFSRARGAADLSPHLTLNLDDREYFFKTILPRESSPKEKRATSTRKKDSHKRMDGALKTAREYLDDILRKREPAEADEYLNKWIDFIDSGLQVIWVQVADEATAFTIFETMNDRGLKLSAADLLKNYLHSKATEEHRTEIMHKWSSMTGVLETVEGEEENVVEYIRCFWVSRNGHTRTRYLYDKIKDKITNPSKALETSSALEASVQDYAAIIMDSHARIKDRGDTARECVKAIKTLGVTQLRPMLLSGFQKLQHGQFESLLEMSVAWSVRFLVCGTPSGTLEGYYSEIAVDIWNDKITTASQALARIEKIVPKDDEFRAKFSVETETTERIARYYLLALQNAKDGRWPDSRLTLEHIVDKKHDPLQHPLNQDDHKAYVARLGNYALLTSDDNGKIQNFTFARKREVYAKVDYASLTAELSKYPSFGTDEIDKRQKDLAELALKAWPVS